MATMIALLRGVNVGGHKMVPMARLREVIEDAGFADVRTYVQSGNVVLEAPERPPDDLARELEAAIEREFGFDVSVIVRTRDELAAVLDGDPFAGVATDPARYHVVFLAEDPGQGLADAVDAADFEPEAYAVRGRDVYLWTPGGIGRSALAKELSKRGTGTGTARNWRTVEKLAALAGIER